MGKVKYSLFLFMLLFNVIANAQQPAANVEMADGFTSSGKIYVVVSVVLIILAGLLLYVIGIDRKLTKLEKEIEKGGK